MRRMTTTRRAIAAATAGMGLFGILSVALSQVPRASAAGPLSIGQPAPDFTGTDTSGKSVRLSDLKGKTVVLEWSNHECPYVVKHYSSGNMQTLQKDATKDGVVWLTIVSSPEGEQGNVAPQKADELTRSRAAAPTSVLLDPAGAIARKYEARVTPHMFVIDRAGILRYMGGIDDKPTTNKDDIPSAKPYVRQALASLAKGEAVADPVTKPYGCSVKYKNGA